MGLVTSTGIFQFIPPNPSINGVSSPTGNINETIQIFGSDLDYIDSITLAGMNCNFNLIDLNTLNMVIPNDPESGNIVASSTEFTVTGNPITFYPIPFIENFTPNNSASGEWINITGKAINTATGAYLYAEPIFDDIEYIFTGSNGQFNITNASELKNSTFIYAQNINLNNSTGFYGVKKIFDYNNNNGRSINVQISPINSKYYESHIFTFPALRATGFQTFSYTIPTGFRSYLVNLPISLPDTNYSIFYRQEMTGLNYDSYISGKSINNFYINFDKNINETGYVNFLVLQNTGINFDNGIYNSTGINIGTGIYTTGIDLSTNKNYPPFLITSVEYSGQGNAYKTNISNLTKDKFNLNLPFATGDYNLKLNYCTLVNSEVDYNTFSYIGESGFYKKIYLYSGNAQTFVEKIPITEYQIFNKNSSRLKVPYTESYIKGKIGFLGPININVETDDEFFESPLPTGVFPPFGIRGTKIIISGKSFKKVILNDGTGDYNYVSVKFRYADSIYQQNDNSFSTDFLLLSHNTLSGLVPFENFPSGKYAIQMISEDGSLFE